MERTDNTTIALGENSFTRSCLVAQQLECLAHGKELLTDSFYFESAYVVAAGTLAQNLFALYTSSCDYTLSAVLTSTGVANTFVPFYKAIEKITDGRYNDDTRSILQKFMVNVDDMQVRGKTTQVGNIPSLIFVNRGSSRDEGNLFS